MGWMGNEPIMDDKMEHYNIENEKEHDQQEGQLSQLSHWQSQRRLHARTYAHLSQEGGRPQRTSWKIAC